MAKKNSTIGAFVAAKKQVEVYRKQIVTEIKDVAKEKGGILLSCFVWGLGLSFVTFSISFAFRLGIGL